MDSGQTIYESAQVCSQLFRHHMEKTDITDGERIVVDDLFGRFSQWAAYTGAFAMPKASLDARLGSHGDIRSSVLEVLFMIRLNMGWGALFYPLSRLVRV